MPRTARASVGGICYHVINRGNGRAEVFHDNDDYDAFVRLMVDAHARLPMRVLAYCLMPNHFHLVLWPNADGDLSRWLQWLLTAHVRRYHRRYQTSGHVWQGRFKAFPIQEDDHLLTVIRYVERNPLRANLVKKVQNWRWSSLTAMAANPPLLFLHPGPTPRPSKWLERVAEPWTEAELERVRHSIQRGTPFGESDWTAQTAAQLGLESSPRPRGRPPRSNK
jgi:putative transposase